MNELQECALIFGEMLNRDYYLYLENGIVLHIFFARRHFKHLLGLHKLKDLAAFDPQRGFSANKIYTMALHGEFEMQTIRNSAFYPLIEKRIQEFPFIEEVFSKKNYHRL